MTGSPGDLFEHRLGSARSPVFWPLADTPKGECGSWCAQPTSTSSLRAEPPGLFARQRARPPRVRPGPLPAQLRRRAIDPAARHRSRAEGGRTAPVRAPVPLARSPFVPASPVALAPASCSPYSRQAPNSQRPRLASIPSSKKPGSRSRLRKKPGQLVPPERLRRSPACRPSGNTSPELRAVEAGARRCRRLSAYPSSKVTTTARRGTAPPRAPAPGFAATGAARSAG